LPRRPPDKVESRFGTLEFKDGAPSADTSAKVYDNLDFTHAYETFVNTMQGVSLVAARRGFLDAGVKDNEILIFSELMDAKSLFLTANADTVYFLGFIDVSKGPMVFEVPPKALGALDDMWFRWVTDFGGTSIAEFLAGRAMLGKITAPPPTVFHEGSGKVMNTVPPNDRASTRCRSRPPRSTPS
jgi:hypothetical protein